jgi:murein DD-endopeptidase MepM/ murein hydrolase activator NlpD
MPTRQLKNNKTSLITTLVSIVVFVAFSNGLIFTPTYVRAETVDSLREQIDEINSEVQRKKGEVEELNSKISHYRNLIENKKLESASLADRLALLENQIAKTEVSIEISEQEIAALNLQVQRLEERISLTKEQITHEQNLLGILIQKLYQRQSSVSMLEVLLAHRTFSDFFDYIYSMVSLQRKMDFTLKRVKELKASLDAERQAREDKLTIVTERKNQLENARRELEDEVLFRAALLDETKASELDYRYMLAELKREQNEADADIAYLEKMLREKIDLSERLTDQVSVLSWPIAPLRGISAIFHDPEYPYRHIFEHPGIDIRASQGSAIRAAAGGIVARAKDAGMGYSYIMLIHNDGVSTVYGHVSRINVKEDTFVERGEIIGYSGGMPGTAGAGRLTTGPHLHFECRLNGIPVDPMSYLVGG